MKGFGRDGEISAWEVFQYFYCPRKLYFIRKLSVYPPERKKMGLSSSEHVHEPARAMRRTTIYGLPEEDVDVVLKDVAAECEELGLIGRADTVLKLKSGEFVPVDVKFTKFTTIPLAWRKQMVAYAVLLESKFSTRIKRGLFYLLPSKRVSWISIGSEDKLILTRDLEKMRKLIDSDIVPQKVSLEKCGYCEVAKFCKRC